VFAILAWFVFVVDLRRIVRQRQSEAAGPAEEELYGVIVRDHRINILLLMPGMMLLNLSAVGGIYSWPEALVRGGDQDGNVHHLQTGSIEHAECFSKPDGSRLCPGLLVGALHS
jgi:hypothetical protein